MLSKFDRERVSSWWRRFGELARRRAEEAEENGRPSTVYRSQALASEYLAERVTEVNDGDNSTGVQEQSEETTCQDNTVLARASVREEVRRGTNGGNQF